MRAGGSPDWGFSLISLSISCSDYLLHFNHFIVSIVSPFDHVSLFLFLLIFMMYVSLCYCFAINLMKCIWKRTRNISLSIPIFRSFISSRWKTSKTASNSERMMVITSPAHYPPFTISPTIYKPISTFTHSLPILCHPIANHDPLPAHLSPTRPLSTLYPLHPHQSVAPI